MLDTTLLLPFLTGIKLVEAAIVLAATTLGIMANPRVKTNKAPDARPATNGASAKLVFSFLLIFNGFSSCKPIPFFSNKYSLFV